jgi:hypothetical protein
MTREEAKKMALSRDCHCIKGENRDSNYDECIDKVFDYFESELKKLRVGDVSGRSEQSNCVHCHEHILTVKTLKYRCKHCGDEKWEQLD